MAYPPLYVRLFNFLRDKNAGLESPEAAKLDAELNTIQLSLAQLRERHNRVTTADGRLKNLAQALAAALVGTWEGTSDGTTTVTTTIPWVSSFSVNSVLVLVNTTPLRPAQIASVSDSGGFLRLTLASAPSNGTPLVVWAYEPGAGLLTRLASTAAPDGASLLGIHDAGGFFAGNTVEEALAETAAALDALTTALGDLNRYFFKDGSRAATGNFDMGGFKVANAADGVDDGDYVTVRQIANYIAAWNDLSRFFLKRDGTTAMAGDLNFGNNKGLNLKDPDLNNPLEAVNVRTLSRVLAVSGASPVGSVIDFIGETPPSDEWLLCDGQVYAATAYPVLAALLPAAYRTGAKQGCIAARFPALVAGAGPGDVAAGSIVTGDILPLFQNLGRGYATPPVVTVRNPDGSTPAGVTIQLTVSATVIDGATVQSGGEITAAQVLAGGTGVQAGAILLFSNTLEELPAGYFRTPDLRGRSTIGAGTESKTPGVVDPPALINGDLYDASNNSIGDAGGTQLAIGNHRHRLFNTDQPGAIAWGGTIGADLYPSGRTAEGGGGADEKYNIVGTTTLPTRGLSGNPVGGGTDTRPPFHTLNKIIKAK